MYAEDNKDQLVEINKQVNEFQQIFLGQYGLRALPA